jgi:AraC-like DNA-binding protein
VPRPRFKTTSITYFATTIHAARTKRETLMQFTVIPIPEMLRKDVECIRISHFEGDEPININVCLNGLPGISFQHANGCSPIERITTRFGGVKGTPTLFVYGQMTEPGVMHYRAGQFTSTQVVLKPHALQTLMGLNASVLTNSVVDLSEFSAGSLNMRLMEAHTDEQRVDLITDFLTAKLRQAKSRDCLVEESLRLIHQNSTSMTVKYLLDTFNLSERQFEKRFTQAVGLPPQFYIRVKRFNQAIRLMKTRPFRKLTDVAYAMNYYDQSHFIREIKAFSGITPKNLFQKVDYHADQRVYAY